MLSRSNKFLGQAELMPMLPGDDQLIYIGEDTTVSIIKTVEKDIDVVDEIEYDVDEDLG